jgi:hypothetical protein
MIRGGSFLMPALLALSFLSGCAGNGPAPSGAGSSSFDQIQQAIFTPHCLSGGCHNGTDRAGNLVLAAGSSYANLVNVAPFNTAAQAMGLLRVVPGQPDQSFLYIKLTLPGAGALGSPMPLIGSLSAADIEQVRLWIMDGAPNSTAPAATPTATLLPVTATASPSPSPTP